MSARMDFTRVSIGGKRPQRPWDVRLRQWLVDEPPWPELAIIVVLVASLAVLGSATDWQALRVLAGFVAGVAR